MIPLLLGDENFDFPLVEGLIEFGYDILTMNDLDLDNQAIPDEEVLALAATLGRVVITFNRRDFIRLHKSDNRHAGIIVCKQFENCKTALEEIHKALSTTDVFSGQLLRVNRPG